MGFDTIEINLVILDFLATSLVFWINNSTCVRDPLGFSDFAQIFLVAHQQCDKKGSEIKDKTSVVLGHTNTATLHPLQCLQYLIDCNAALTAKPETLVPGKWFIPRLLGVHINFR